jgi:uncharacterized protein (TIGR00369 family)
MIEPVRERTVRWDDPQPTARAARKLSGLDLLRALVSGELPRPPIAQLMGFELTEVEEGRAVFECVPGEHLYNPIGSVHGGFACTLLDSALGCSVQSTLPAGATYVTTDVQVRFIRAITSSSGRVRAEAKVVHVGRSTAVAEARLTGEDGKLLAFGTTACAIFRP